MRINITYHEKIAILNIIGEIDINSSVLIEMVGKLLRRGTNKIIINLGDVNFIDYNGLSVLAIAYKSVLNVKGIVKLAHVPVRVMELLRIVRLDNVFDIYKNLDKAIKSFDPKEGPCKEILPDDSPLRRKFQRLDMDISIYYKRTESDDKENPLYSGLAGNLSGAGLFLRGINMLPAGTKVDLDIVLPKESEKSITLQGIVMWIADKQLQPDFYPGMGVQFIDIARDAQEELIGFIEKNIAK